MKLLSLPTITIYWLLRETIYSKSISRSVLFWELRKEERNSRNSHFILQTKNPYAVIRNDCRKQLSTKERPTSLKKRFRQYTLYKFRKSGDFCILEGLVIRIHREQITRGTVTLKCGFRSLSPRIY